MPVIHFVRRTAVLYGLVFVLALIATGTASAAIQPAASSHLIMADWQMDESAGAKLMIDSSGRGHDGKIGKGVSVGHSGYQGLAYKFNGNHAFVSIPNARDFDHRVRPFDVSLEFKSTTLPSSSVGDYDLIRKGLSTATGGDWKMEVLRSGHVYCYFQGSKKAVGVTGTSNVVDGRWHKLECKLSTTGLSVVVNGSVQAWVKGIPGTIVNGDPITIGARDTPTADDADSTVGKIDDVVIYKTED